MKRLMTLLIAVPVATAAIVAASGAASGAPGGSLSTLHIALTGKTGVSVSEKTVPSGAVNVVTTFSGNGRGDFGIIRLNDGVTLQQAIHAVQSHDGDLNALTPYGALVVAAPAPGRLQTDLKPSDNYYAINTGGHQPAFAPFKVRKNSSPAALPKAAASQKAIEFGFHGPSQLHRGTIVRERNKGYLVHMIDMVGARNKEAAKKLAHGLHAGKSRKALRPYLNGQFVNLMDPASPGALQQSVLHAKPGYYVEACFMDTQDGREHTQLGMERIVRVVK